MKRAVLLTIIFAILVASGTFLLKNQPISLPESNPAQEQENASGEVLTGDVVTVATGTKYLSAEISYPKSNLLVKNKVLSEYYSWASDTEIFKMTDQTAKDMGLQEGMGYQYQAEYQLATSSDTTSYVYDIYTFTAGAHGSAYTKVYSFDNAGKEIDIAKSLTDTQIQKMSKIAFEDIKKQMLKNLEANSEDAAEINTEWLKEGTSPKRENYSVAWYEGEDLVVYFGQYQVAPYVFGEFEVRIPKKSL